MLLITERSLELCRGHEEFSTQLQTLLPPPLALVLLLEEKDVILGVLMGTVP